MGRKSVGPRKLHGPEGLYYAIYRDSSGKTYRESLGTRDHTKAQRLWPAAFQRCQDRANGTAPTFVPPMPGEMAEVPLMVEDGKGGITPHPTETELEPAEWFCEPEQFEVSWAQAFQIHNQRIGAKRGRAIAESTLKNQLAARKGVDKPPQSFTVTDVRRYEQQLWDQGLSANTVSQRFGMMRAVMTSLRKKGYLETNVFDRIEVSAKQGESHKTATPAECKLLWDSGNWNIRLLLYTGMRANELLSRRPEDLKDGWLDLCEYPGFRLKNKNSIRELLLPDWCDDTWPQQFPTSSTLWRHVKAVTPECNVHSLRHAYREALRIAQVPTEMAERILGHAHKGQVGVYGTFARESIEPAMRAAWKVVDEWVR